MTTSNDDLKQHVTETAEALKSHVTGVLTGALAAANKPFDAQLHRVEKSPWTPFIVIGAMAGLIAAGWIGKGPFRLSGRTVRSSCGTLPAGTENLPRAVATRRGAFLEAMR